jgi:hypothetical protein
MADTTSGTKRPAAAVDVPDDATDAQLDSIKKLIEQFNTKTIDTVRYDCVWVTMGYLNDDSSGDFDKRMPVKRPKPGSGDAMSEQDIKNMLLILQERRDIEGFL